MGSTGLGARLKGLGVTRVAIVGVSTGSGVETTARRAYEAGFNVPLALDAMTGLRPEAHDHSVRTVFPRLGETGTTQGIIDLRNSGFGARDCGLADPERSDLTTLQIKPAIMQRFYGAPPNRAISVAAANEGQSGR